MSGRRQGEERERERERRGEAAGRVGERGGQLGWFGFWRKGPKNKEVQMGNTHIL